MIEEPYCGEHRHIYNKRSQLQEPFASVSVYRSSAVRALSKCSHCFESSIAFLHSNDLQ